MVAYRYSRPYKSNAKTWAKKFTARLLEPGIVSYEDCGAGVALLKKETISKYADSFVGRPLVLTNDYKHKRVSPQTLEEHAEGYLSLIHI